MESDRPNHDPEPTVDELVSELAQLARNAPDKLSDHVAALSVPEQAELALRLPAKERLELLLHAPKPMRLVRSLPDSEFYLTVREVGPTDALPLVALSSSEQIGHLIDLESWRRDRFDPARSGAWVALLLDAGEPTIKRFIRSSDNSLLTLLFQRWVRTRSIDYDDAEEQGGHTEAGDERGFVSPDGNFRFTPIIAEHAPAIQRITQMFYLDQPDRFQEILRDSVDELPAELEEQALHWRNSRLEEHGYPPWEEALHVYAAPQGLTTHPVPPDPIDSDGLRASRSALRELPGGDVLLAGIESMTGDLRERALHELLSLANRLLVADGADTGNLGAHREALRKASGVVRIALEFRGVDDPRRLGALLAEVPLVELFREGHARAAELQTRARELIDHGWAASHERACELLDSPLRERVDALLIHRPKYLEIREDGSGVPRSFLASAEIEETRLALDMAEVLGQVLLSDMQLDPEAALAAGSHVIRPTFSTLFLTALAWHSTRDALAVAPLPPDVVADFLRNVASRRTADPEASGRALTALTRKLASRRATLSTRELAVFQAFGRSALERLSAECGGLDPGVPVDPRSISCILLAET